MLRLIKLLNDSKTYTSASIIIPFTQTPRETLAIRLSPPHHEDRHHHKKYISHGVP